MSHSTFGANLFYSGFSGSLGLSGLSGVSGLTGSNKIYVHNFQRDLTTASGSQSVTGVGFQPRFIFTSYGLITGHTSSGVAILGLNANEGGFVRTSGGVFYPTDQVIVETSTGNYQTGKLASFDSDGFTINWIKVGSPTGTLVGYYAAIG